MRFRFKMEIEPRMIGVLEQTLKGYAALHKDKSPEYQSRLNDHVQTLIEDLMPEPKFQVQLKEFYDKEKVKG